MQLSFIGLAVGAVLLLLGWRLGAALTIGFFASLPLQATSFATLTSLGGSSPPLAMLFSVLLIMHIFFSRGSIIALERTFREQPSALIIVALMLQIMVGAMILPRLFAGTTSAFIPFMGAIAEVPLSPVGGNITQVCYIIVGVLMFLAFSVALTRVEAWPSVVKGMFIMIAVNAIAGFANWGGNVAGMGDVLAPIRTASYAFLTETQEGGLFRIAGGCSEASAFATLSLSCLGFCISYWRRSGSTTALVLGLSHFVLLVLSTSSTAYVSLAIMGGWLGCGIAWDLLGKGRVQNRDLRLFGMALVACAGVLVIMLCVPEISNTFANILDSMVFKKQLSSSGQQRAYINAQSLQNVLDTYGLGVGVGSTRASSWVVAVLSQAGVFGALAFGALLVAVWRAPASINPRLQLPGNVNLQDFAIGTRAAIFGGLIGSSLSGSGVDPGTFTFVCFAIVLSAAALSRRLFKDEAGFQLAPLPGGTRAC